MSQIILKTRQPAGRPPAPNVPRFSPLEPARWAWLVILATAPWFYGCVLPWTWPWFFAALGIVTILWIGGLLIRRRRPGVPWLLLALAGWLLGHGWLLTVNAGFRYERTLYEFLAIKPRLASWLPQAIDNADAYPAMLRFTGLLGILLLAADAAQNPLWRKRLFWTLTINGTALAAYGLVQRSLPDALIYWRRQDMDHSLFASYFYHGNAGAYLNLVLPFAFGAAVRAFVSPQISSAQRAFGAAALFLNLAGAMVIASKAAQCVTLLLLGALVFVYRRELGLRKNRAVWSTQWKRAFAIGALGAVCVAVLAFSSGRAVERWSFLPKILNQDNARLLAYQACLKMLPDAGWWGIGPANFAIAFPHYTNGMPFALLGRWAYAHEDYLQTTIEWGWIGAAVWSALVVGALWRGRWTSWQAVIVKHSGAATPSSSAILQRSAWLALIGILLHAAVDFPLQIGSMQVFALTLIGLLWNQSTLAPPATTLAILPKR